MKRKLLSLLVLLMTAATGAWAETETLLTTITATGKTTYTMSPEGVATVTLNNIYMYGAGEWNAGGTVTVEAAEGYTITRCVVFA